MIEIYSIQMELAGITKMANPKTLIVIGLLVAGVLGGGLLFLVFFTMPGPVIMPGLHYEPNSKDQALVVRQEDHETWTPYTEKIRNFLHEYDHPHAGKENLVSCNEDFYPNKGHICRFHLEQLGNECTYENHYGYHIGKPCVVLYPSMEEDWIPEYYTVNDTLPKSMPKELQDHIEKVKHHPLQMNTLWVSCKPEKNLKNGTALEIKFTPQPGFAGYYFPARHSIDGYMNPLVAVQFTSSTRVNSVAIRCRLWAKNIPSKWAHVRFTLSVD